MCHVLLESLEFVSNEGVLSALVPLLVCVVVVITEQKAHQNHGDYSINLKFHLVVENNTGDPPGAPPFAVFEGWEPRSLWDYKCESCVLSVTSIAFQSILSTMSFRGVKRSETRRNLLFAFVTLSASQKQVPRRYSSSE